MNFYKAQDDAHKKTRLLVFYFTMAIVGTVLVMHAAVSVVLLLGMGKLKSAEGFSEEPAAYTDYLFSLETFAVVSIATILVILSGWFFKRAQVSGGGWKVAAALGGRHVHPDTRDPEERQLINVVEEMAIASGTPVPQIWVMDEDSGINAFAAGTEPGNAVIGVTRGTLQRLNRAELQGVVAHEFSHILNGDMKLNIRLMCMLHGLLLITILGYTVLRLAYYSGGSSRRKGEGNAGMILLGIGVVAIVIGTVGNIFASMIQAAISRQREYLADASAVEFTMDPSGIAGALKKIGGASQRSNVSSPVASEMEHMFFASAGIFKYGMASHPPLEERIGLIEPEWDGEYADSSIRDVREQEELRSQQTSRRGGVLGQMDAMGPAVVMAGALLDDLGESSNTQLKKGQNIVAGLDTTWMDACHDKYRAQLLILGLLLAQDDTLRGGELQHLKSNIGEEMTTAAIAWHGELSDIHSSKKIALIDLCIPTLRRLSGQEYDVFISLTQWLIRSDGSVDLFEFMLQKVLQRHLDVHFKGSKNSSVKYRNIKQLENEANVIISTIAGVGAANTEDLDSAYRAAASMLEEQGCAALSIVPPAQCGLDVIDQALLKFDTSTPLLKKQILMTCGKAVMHDGEVTSREAELLRAIADAIGCTVPPFVKA